MYAKLLFALILGLANLSFLLAGCSSDLDCSLLGDCVSGKCLCDPGWKGEKCGLVDLLPTPRYGGYRNTSMASWGGKAIEIGKEWHMFASAISNKCPLKQFSTNSFSMHATSKRPGGPYTMSDVALPEFHHSTTVTRVNESTIALFTIGKDMKGKNVHDCSHENLSPAYLNEINDVPIGPHDYMSVSLSNEGPKGPWHEHVIFETDPATIGQWNCNKSNPSPILFENGTVLLMYRGTPCEKDHSCSNDTINLCEHQGIAVADSIEGPYRDRQGMISELSGNEDAVFFRTRRGYAAIFHGKNGCGNGKNGTEDGHKSCGRLGYSKDTWSWTMNDEPCYDSRIIWREENGETTEDKLLSRQRPKIFFDKDGYTPLFLSNGALATDSNEMEFTLASPFNVQENRDLYS